MRKELCILSLIFIAMIGTGAYAAVEPVITANGMSGTVNVTADSPVTVSVQLSPGDKEGTDADWWVVCNAFGKWYYYTLDGRWTDIGEPADAGSLRPTYQGGLVNMQPTDLIRISELAAGNYTLYFGIDTNMNGKLDADSLVFGAVEVAVGNADSISEFSTADSPSSRDYEITGLMMPSYRYTLNDPSHIPPITYAPKINISGIDGTHLWLLNEYKGLMLYDISEPDSPQFAGQMSVDDGYPIDMRFEDSRAYIITLSANQESSRIRIVNIGDKTNPNPAGYIDIEGEISDFRIVGNMFYAVSVEQGVSLTLIDVSDADNPHITDQQNFGRMTSIYFAEQSSSAFSMEAELNKTGYQTIITYIDISDSAGKITKRGFVTIPGTEFGADYYNGFFRVRSIQRTDFVNGTGRLFVLDATNPDQMKQVGSLNLGEGMSTHSMIRFDKNRAYIDSSNNGMIEQIALIDLSDPANPTVKGNLTVPGSKSQDYSAGRIESEKDRLIVLNPDGWTVSLFDVSKLENPSLTNQVSFGNGDSPFSNEHSIRTFTVADDLNLIILSYARDSLKPDDRVQLIDYSANGLKARGWVSHKGNVLQSPGVPDRLFSVSDGDIRVIDISDRDHPQITARLLTMLNITDFVPLRNGYGVQIIENNGQYILRAVPLSDPENGKAVSETVSDETTYSGAFADGNMFYLVSKVSSDTRIRVIDFSDPANPVRRGSIEANGYYYKPPREYLSLYRRYSQGEILRMNDSILILTSSSGYGNEQNNSIKVIDFSDPDHPRQISGLTFYGDGIFGYFMNGNMLWFSRSIAGENASQSKYYLERADLSDPSNPVRLPSVNIPGICIGTDKTGKYAYTINTEYNEYNHIYTFNSVKLTDDKAYLTDKATLTAAYFAGEVAVADGFAYLIPATADRVVLVDISKPEKLIVYEYKANGYPDILGVKNRKIFASVSEVISCYDASDIGKLTLNESAGYADRYRIAFSGSNAYIPMGYYGVWVKSLDN